MKRLRILPLTVVILALVMVSSCGGKSKYEPSEVKIEDEAGSFLNVRVEKADRNGGTFTLENCGDQRITYSDRNFLEKQIMGNGMVWWPTIRER